MFGERKPFFRVTGNIVAHLVAGQPECDSKATIPRCHSVCIYVDDRKKLLWETSFVFAFFEAFSERLKNARGHFGSVYVLQV